MKLLHLFLYGYPEYDVEGLDQPNMYNPNHENSPPREIKATLYESLIWIIHIHVNKSPRQNELVNVDVNNYS